MGLDLSLLVLVLLSCAWGAFRGAARQVAQILALIAATFLSQTLSMHLSPMFAGHGLPSSVFDHRSQIATVLAFLAVYIGLGAILRVAIKRLLGQDDFRRRKADRTIGMFLGGIKFVAAAYLGLCLWVLVRASLPIQINWLDEITRSSAAYRLASQKNLLQSDQKLLAELGLGKDWTLTPRIDRSPLFEMLKDNPKYREILARPAMVKALEKGDSREVLRRLLRELQKDHEETLLKPAAAAER